VPAEPLAPLPLPAAVIAVPALPAAPPLAPAVAFGFSAAGSSLLQAASAINAEQTHETL
jgi:hypothetical protein